MNYPIVIFPEELITIVKRNLLLENRPVKPLPPEKSVIIGGVQLPQKPIKPILEKKNIWLSSTILILLSIYFVHLNDKTHKSFYEIIAMILFFALIIRAFRNFQKNEEIEDKFQSNSYEYNKLLKNWEIKCKNIDKEYISNLEKIDVSYQKEVEKYNTITFKNYEKKLEEFNIYVNTDEAKKEMIELKLGCLTEYLSLNVTRGTWYELSLSSRRGVSEKAFCEYLQKNWKDIDEEKFFTMKSFSLNQAIDGSNYRPDITFELLISGKFVENKEEFFFVNDNSIYVDIEIDEPYVGLTGQPIHYIDCGDSIRDSFFIKNGWIVVRFTEEQVVKKPNLCIDLLHDIVLDCLGYSTTDLSKFPNLPYTSKLLLKSTTRYERWTRDEAHEMAFRRYRNTYLSKAFVEYLPTETRNED